MKIKINKLRNIVHNVLLEMSVYNDPIPSGSTVTILESELDISKLDNIQQDLEPNIKPKGLFYGCGSEWADFVNNPSNEMSSWHKKGKFMYSLKIKYTSLDKPDRGAVLKIDSDEKFEEFLKSFDTGYDLIEWNFVASNFGGIELCPLPDGPMWLRTWDVSQGCVWNKKAIVDYKLMSQSNKIMSQVLQQYPQMDEDLEYFEYNYPGAGWENLTIKDFLDEYEGWVDNKGDWEDGWLDNRTSALVALQCLIYDGNENRMGWENLAYSGLDFNDIYEMTEKACKRYNIKVPPGLEDVADDLQDNQDQDRDLGSDWRDKWDY